MLSVRQVNLSYLALIHFNLNDVAQDKAVVLELLIAYSVVLFRPKSWEGRIFGRMAPLPWLHANREKRRPSPHIFNDDRNHN